MANHQSRQRQARGELNGQKGADSGCGVGRSRCPSQQTRDSWAALIQCGIGGFEERKIELVSLICGSGNWGTRKTNMKDNCLLFFIKGLKPFFIKMKRLCPSYDFFITRSNQNKDEARDLHRLRHFKQQGHKLKCSIIY